MTAVTELARTARTSEVIVTCTTARAPFLEPSMVSPGTFIAAVGADSPDKNEVHPELLARTLAVTDILDQCVEMGDLRHAIGAGTMRCDDVHAELAQIIVGERPGRTSEDRITLFDSTGTALQDVAAAAVIYRRAMADQTSLAFRFGAE